MLDLFGVNLFCCFILFMFIRYNDELKQDNVFVNLSVEKTSRFILMIFYWFLPEMCTVFNLEANWFQLYQGAHEVADILK